MIVFLFTSIITGIGIRGMELGWINENRRLEASFDFKISLIRSQEMDTTRISGGLYVKNYTGSSGNFSLYIKNGIFSDNIKTDSSPFYIFISVYTGIGVRWSMVKDRLWLFLDEGFVLPPFGAPVNDFNSPVKVNLGGRVAW